MRVSRPALAIVMLSMCIALSGHGAALAQTDTPIEARLRAAVKKLENGCRADLTKYCDTVTPGEGRQVLCLQAHEDKLSSACDYALFDATRNLDRALDRLEQTADACWEDIEKNCAAIPLGGGQVGQCLVAKKASLSEACRSVVNQFGPAK